jgi:hypothetical protein
VAEEVDFLSVMLLAEAIHQLSLLLASVELQPLILNSLLQLLPLLQDSHSEEEELGSNSAV